MHASNECINILLIKEPTSADAEADIEPSSVDSPAIIEPSAPIVAHVPVDTPVVDDALDSEVAVDSETPVLDNEPAEVSEKTVGSVDLEVEVPTIT